MRLSNSDAEFEFDPRTGATRYIQPRGSLWQQTRKLMAGVPGPAKWILCAGVLWIAYEGAQWALLRRRTQRLRRQALECTEVEDLIALLYSIAPAHLGGFLTNATVSAVERAPNTGGEGDGRVLMFASGGWRYTPHTLSALPLAMPFPGTHASQDERLLWWLAVSLGKGMVLNGALAFIISSMLLQAERDGAPGGSRLRYQGRRIVDVGFCTGALYQSVTPLQRAAAASVASSSASASSGVTSVPCPPISRLELVCEIGTLSPSRVNAYRAAHWGMPPDPRSEALADVAHMGTQNVLAYWQSRRCLPDAATPAFEDVLWEKRAVTPPSGRDGWVVLEVEGLTGPGGPTEKVHVDLGIYFARGLCAGWQEDRTKSAKALQGDDASSSSSSAMSLSHAWKSIRGSFSRLQLRLSKVLPSMLCPSVTTSSTTPLHPTGALPRPFILPDSLVSSTGRSGLGARINEQSSGARDSIALLQRLVLMNSKEPPNTTHAHMRSLLLEALQLCGLRNRFLTHAIPPASHFRTRRDTPSRMNTTTPPGGASTAAWPEHHVPSAHAAPRARQGRSARQRAQRKAKQRAEAASEEQSEEEEEESQSDADEDVIDVDTQSAPREVDMVD